MSFLVFLIQVIGISLTGVMAPGPVTTATIAAGARSRHAGGLIAVGHGIAEFPLMVLIISGMGRLFESDEVKIGIGLMGGAFLIWLSLGLMRSSAQNSKPVNKHQQQGPLWTGVLLTVGNPYFLFWWATIGLALASQALELGVFAFVLFAVIHWLCDLIWLEILSWTSFKGTLLLGEHRQHQVLRICGVAMLFFGGRFIYLAVFDIVRIMS